VSDRKLTFIDFFSGIGGFRLGLEQAGMKCIGFCERDKFAVKSYRAMYDTEGEWYSDDITELKSADIPKADVWTAGSPCQNVSIAGGRSGILSALSLRESLATQVRIYLCGALETEAVSFLNSLTYQAAR
jgi:site-specific DNA-cytosine methylase